MEQKTLEFSIDLPEEDGIVTTQSGTKFILQTILSSIEEFNKTCPKPGCILNRNHIGQKGKHTHVVHLLKYEHNKLIATIEPLISGLENMKIRPIIQIPLRFGSGIQKEIVLKIADIFLED